CEGETSSLFVLYQTSDVEPENITSQLQAVTQSLTWELESDLDEDYGVDPSEFNNLSGIGE
ncbi:MAG: hypothetical protein VB858_10615, partial [Planctomycetaceae bacterium]